MNSAGRAYVLAGNDMPTRATTRYLPLALALLTSAVSTAAPAAKKPALGELVMDGHDAGHATYADKCSNGGNSDEANRGKFIAAMVADKKSKLAIALADTETRFVNDSQWMEVALGDWQQTFHLRDGCGETDASYSAMILVRGKMGNSHELWAKYLVTIDDDVSQTVRKLGLRSIQPLVMREQP